MFGQALQVAVQQTQRRSEMAVSTVALVVDTILIMAPLAAVPQMQHKPATSTIEVAECTVITMPWERT